MKNKRTIKFKLPSKVLDRSQKQVKDLDRVKKLTRTKRIKQKNVVYPLSTPQKIVFITNQYGNGFKKQKTQEFHWPMYIPVDSMLREVNQVCYNQWKIHFQRLSALPFEKIQQGLGVTIFLIFLIATIYFFLISRQQANAFEILNYLIMAMILIILILSFKVCLSRRDRDQNLDSHLINAIQRKLIKINNNILDLDGAAIKNVYGQPSICYD